MNSFQMRHLPRLSLNPTTFSLCEMTHVRAHSFSTVFVMDSALINVEGCFVLWTPDMHHKEGCALLC